MRANLLNPILLSSLYLGSASARSYPRLLQRQIPADPKNVTTITSPNGARIRYKEPGKAGVCETTPNVDSYSGYVDVDEETHMFFWFFESRRDPKNDPITLWLNGGPGSDSLIGLFEEFGPCNVSIINGEHVTEINPYAWNEVSNLLFLSQPLSVGFSYAEEEIGSVDNQTGLVVNSSVATPDGRYSTVDPQRLDTTEKAAASAWEILQGFFSNLPKLDPEIESKTFNLWTESYGGHYGPTFFRYFEEKNDAISAGTESGVKLTMDTLGIGNGIIDEKIQAIYYPEMAVNNSYGIKAVNDTIYEYMVRSYYLPGGCRDSYDQCAAADRNTVTGRATCAEATAICRTMVETPYYTLGDRGVYDIRHPLDDPTPPDYYPDYLNQAWVQDAVGVRLNYTSVSSQYIWLGFDASGDFLYPNFKKDLETLLNRGVRVALYYGDADYICNWYGGEALSLQLNYTHTKEFNAAGYAPFTVDGEKYGDVRQYGNFSFLRIYDAGHLVPYYQPKASLEFFRRVLENQAVADGSPLTDGYSTEGPATSNHTEPFVPLPPTTTSSESSTSTVSATAIPRRRRE